MVQKLLEFLESLYGWPGYDFWGVILTVLGLSGTALLAGKASKNSKIAAQAAKRARTSMDMADAVSQLNLVRQMIVELRLRVEGKQWQQVTETCQSIRVVLSPLLTYPTIEFSEDVEKSLVGLQTQMSTLQKNADETRYNEQPFNFVKTSAMISRQAEAVALAIREAKDKTHVVKN